MSKCHKHDIINDLHIKVCPACFGEWHANEVRLAQENYRLLSVLEKIAQLGLEPFKMPDHMLTYSHILDIVRDALQKGL